MKIVLAISFIILGFVLVMGGSVWYVRSTVQHECQALEFILHSNPQNQRFLDAIRYWANADGCR